MVGPGGRLVVNAGCVPQARVGGGGLRLTGESTTDPTRVTCRVCKVLPSYRRAIRNP